MRRFSTGAAACNILQETRFANAERQIAVNGRADHHGLQLVLAACGGVIGGKWKLIERKARAIPHAQRFQQSFGANRRHPYQLVRLLRIGTRHVHCARAC